MADKIKDADDLLLESMFHPEPIADDGFSMRVVRRVRRKLWIRRLSLPIAAAIGVSIAAKPLAGLVTAVFGVLAALPVDIAVPADSLPPLHFIVSGAIILFGALIGLRSISE